MKIVIHHHSALEHQLILGKLLAEGMKKHGETVFYAEAWNPIDCDLAVVWGHRLSRMGWIRENQLLAGRRYLVMERGYFADRMEWTSLGYDGLNGRADFCNSGNGPKRWNPHKELMRPWKAGGEHILLIGQVDGDASIENFNIGAWYERTVKQIRRITGMPIHFRPHPLTKQTIHIPGADTVSGTLAACFRNTYCAVTWNSNTAVDATLAGVPCITMDAGSMAYDVTSHTLDKVITPSRQKWANELAWCQWTEKEIANGDAWDHLKPGAELEPLRDDSADS